MKAMEFVKDIEKGMEPTEDKYHAPHFFYSLDADDLDEELINAVQVKGVLTELGKKKSFKELSERYIGLIEEYVDLVHDLISEMHDEDHAISTRIIAQSLKPGKYPISRSHANSEIDIDK